MSNQVTDQASEWQTNATPQGTQAQGQAGGGYPGYGNPSVAGTQAPAYASASVVPQQQQRRGGMINKFKMPPVALGTGNQLLKMLLAEFFGTFLLVFFGIGSVLTASGGGSTFFWVKGENDKFVFMTPCEIARAGPSVPCSLASVDPDTLDKALKAQKLTHISTYVVVHPGSEVTALHVSFGFGIAVACIAQALGHISGAHLNPAVSFGLVAAGECSILKALVYSGVQIFGAVCGAGALKGLTWNYLKSIDPSPAYINMAPDKRPVFDPSKHTVGWSLGTSELGTAGYVDGIVIECILTFILVLTVCGACDSLRKDVKGSAPLAIGFAVFLCHVVGISYTGSSVNPARSIGPVFFTMDSAKYGLRHLVVYIVGPLLGGILAGVLYNVFFRAPPSEEDNPQVSPGRN